MGGGEKRPWKVATRWGGAGQAEARYPQKAGQQQPTTRKEVVEAKGERESPPSTR